ncbi:MAG: ankyrin repeat domain-containing protein [Chitinophagaceae bacterium]|nr:MAG: ankyrin repeat domain-containing protein [Chitinophagaceae bacterium]
MFLPRQLLELKALVDLPADVERFLARRPQGRVFVDIIPFPRAGVLAHYQALMDRGITHLLPFARHRSGRELLVNLRSGAVCWLDAPEEAVYPSFENFLEVEGRRAAAIRRIPIVQAARRGERARIERLLRRGADINVLDIHGLTPLMAALLAWQFDTAHFLLDSGADVHVASAAGDTALMFAALGNRPDLVARLLGGGADPNARTGMGIPVLHFAMTGPYPLAQGRPWGNIEVVRLLLAAGADPCVPVFRKSLWDAAGPETDPAIVALLRQAAQDRGCGAPGSE